MIISEKRHSEAYNAIHKPVMDLRVRIQMGEDVDIDDELFKIVGEIHGNLVGALNLRKGSNDR